jgi:uncharacterized protein
MRTSIDHSEVETVLRDSGSSWSAAQAHGLLCSRLSVLGADGGPDWLGLILQAKDASSTSHGDDLVLLDNLYSETFRQLSERQSEFEPLLPADGESAAAIAAAMAEWCEGFLHGLVSAAKGESLKQKLAAEPLSDIIRDMLEITRAAADDDDDEANEEALTELTEYLRVAAQMVYEELADLRHAAERSPHSPESDALH